jgi:hypothetical protein
MSASGGTGGIFVTIILIALGTTGSACANEERTSRAAIVPIPAALPPSSGRTFHISQAGDDTGPGTRVRPWRTIQKALDTLRPGQRALVEAGTYTQDLVVDRAGTARAPITIAAQPGSRVVLHAASTSGDTYPLRITTGAAYVRVRGFVIEHARGTSSTNVYFEGSAHHIELNGNEIRFSQDQGLFSERTTSNLMLLRNRIHANGLGHESGQHQSHGIYLEGTDHYVANNAVHDHRFGFGIQVYPANSGSVIVNNTVVGSAHSGIVVGGEGGVSDITIRNNILAFNRRYGVQMDAVCPDGPVVVDTNVIFGNPYGPIEKGCLQVDTSGSNIYADPRFVARTAGDFRLRAGSPAVDRARADAAPRTDHLGQPRPRGRADIGAFERRG